MSSGRIAGRVLVVDDDALLLTQIADVLRPAGFAVVTSPSAIKALDLVKSDSFDLILSDLRMSRMDGFEFRDNLRADPVTAGIPFCVLTGSQAEEDVVTAERLGARQFLRKPIEPSRLIAVVKQMVAMAAAASRLRRGTEVAQRALARLGYVCKPTVGGALAAHVTFHSVELENAFTHERIVEGMIRNVDHERVRFETPVHLANLGPISILDLDDAADFERKVLQVYTARVKNQASSRARLDRWRIRSESDVRSFRHIARLRIGGVEIAFSLPDGDEIASVERIGTDPLDDIPDAMRRVSLAGARTATDVEIALDPVVARVKTELARLAEVRAERARQHEADAVASAEPFELGSEAIVHPEPLIESIEPEPLLLEELSGAAGPGGTILVCSECGRTYVLGEEVPDERLLMTCERCLDPPLGRA